MTAAAVAVQRSTADRCEIFDRDRDEGAGKNREISNLIFKFSKTFYFQFL